MNGNVLIIGNKQYEYLSMNSIIDAFDTNIRCNMSLPNKNNGTKTDDLALCSHLYERLITNKRSKNDFISLYKKEYKEECIIEFYNNFKISNYKKIFYAKPDTKKYNDLLKKYKCTFSFSSQPRTGYIALFEKLLKKNDNTDIFVTNFSICNEVRKTYYVKDFVFDREEKNTTVHSKSQELNILRWLHQHNKIDATLCMLENKKEITLRCNGLIPSKLIIDKFKITNIQD